VLAQTALQLGNLYAFHSHMIVITSHKGKDEVGLGLSRSRKFLQPCALPGSSLTRACGLAAVIGRRWTAGPAAPVFAAPGMTTDLAVEPTAA
jgi:hypothetical protein